MSHAGSEAPIVRPQSGHPNTITPYKNKRVTGGTTGKKSAIDLGDYDLNDRIEKDKSIRIVNNGRQSTPPQNE